MVHQEDTSKSVNRLPPADVQGGSAVELSARAAQRLSVLGEMTGGVAHDFRNILAVIDSSLALAERNFSEPEMVRTFVAGAREGVARGMRMTCQLLNFARQKELHSSAVDVNALLVNLELFLKYGVGSSIRIALEFSPNLPKCPVDPPQFASAILNLVINARDAMPNGGIIQISTAQCELEPAALNEATSSGAYVRVRVKDNGLGMPDEVMQRIFEPYFTTKGEKGTGLGVPQVCAFIRHIGGRLNVMSELDRGTTVDLFFPTIQM